MSYNDLTYDQWMQQVDAEVLKITCNEIGVHTLADWMSYDCWEDGMTPYEGAIEALENDDMGPMILESAGIEV